jgi:hypothetical protein
MICCQFNFELLQNSLTVSLQTLYADYGTRIEVNSPECRWGEPSVMITWCKGILVNTRDVIITKGVRGMLPQVL